MTTLIRAIDALEVRGDPASTDIRSVEFDSRRVGEGSLFCCVPGTRTDGHLHAAEAVGRGATALLCERILDLDVLQARVASGTARPAMASLAAAFYGRPAEAMAMVGITGTNGKTTVTHLVQAVLEHAGIATGVIGTLAGERTTPEAPDLQRRLAEFRRDHRGAVAMEVSSHAMTQHRVDGVVFDVAAFTNLSRDHLDHHGSMEEYYQAKARLFTPDRARVAVVAVDDPWGRRLASDWSVRPWSRCAATKPPRWSPPWGGPRSVGAGGGWTWPSPAGSTWTTPWSPQRWPPPWAWARTRWPKVSVPPVRCRAGWRWSVDRSRSSSTTPIPRPDSRRP